MTGGSIESRLLAEDLRQLATGMPSGRPAGDELLERADGTVGHKRRGLADHPGSAEQTTDEGPRQPLSDGRPDPCPLERKVVSAWHAHQSYTRGATRVNRKPREVSCHSFYDHLSGLDVSPHSGDCTPNPGVLPMPVRSGRVSELHATYNKGLHA